MGTALYIVTKKKIRGLDLFVNGKAIGAVDDQALDKLCEKLGVASLLGFISQDPDELEEFLDDEGIDAEGDGEFPAEEWFEPAEGLRTVSALTNHLEANPSSLPNSEAIVEDLREYEVLLGKLQEKKALWHLAVDF